MLAQHRRLPARTAPGKATIFPVMMHLPFGSRCCLPQGRSAPSLLRSLLLSAVLLFALSQPVMAVADLTQPQSERLQRYLPRTFEKLQNRQDIHILALGDSITEVKTPNLDRMSALNSYYGIFAQLLARKFFYTGDVRLHDPRDWEEEKFNPDLGPEITVENMGLGGRFIFHGLQHLYTDALENDPDLVMINFGVNDANMAIPLFEYVEAFKKAVLFLRSQGTDVILLGPSHVFKRSFLNHIPITRPYASALEDLARQMDVLYFDFGIPTWNSYRVMEGETPDEVLKQTLSEATRLYYAADGSLDPLHPNTEGQVRMGRFIFNELIDPSPLYADYEFRAKFYPNLEEGGRLEVEMINRTNEPQAGFVEPLGIGQAIRALDLKPAAFDLKPGESAFFEFPYESARDSHDEHFVLRYDLPAGQEPFFRVPLIIMDKRKSQVRTIKAQHYPIGIIWRLGRTERVKDEFTVLGLMRNPQSEPVKGSYTARFQEQEITGEFELPAVDDQEVANQKLELTFALKRPENGHFHVAGDMLVDFTLEDGSKFRVRRAVSLLKHLTLGEKAIMHRWVRRPDIQEAQPTKERMEFVVTANEAGLTIDARLSGYDFHEYPDEPTAKMSIGIDAQSAQYRGTLGYFRNTVVFIPYRGQAEVDSFRRANFGLQYVERLQSDPIKTEIQYLEDGTRRLGVFIPRVLMHHHEWELGSRDSWLGFDLNFSRNDPDRNFHFDTYNEQIWVKNGLAYPDPIGLGVLELTDRPSPYWRMVVQ